MKKKRFILFCLLIFFGIAAGCIYLFASPPFIEQVNIGQKKWDGLGIKNYHIVIQFYEAFATGLLTKRDVIVKNGSVVNSSCIDNECPAFVLQNVYTVDDLFRVAKGSTIAGYGKSYNECVQKITMNHIYGFPQSMDVDCPHGADEEHSFEVILFEVLK
jgi:hypothetical protein